MATKKLIVTLAVEVDYDPADHKPIEVATTLQGRLTSFLYDVGIKVANVDIASIEHNS